MESEALKEGVSLHSDLEDFHFTVGNDIRRRPFGEPGPLEVDHVSAVILERVEEPDVILGEVSVELLSVYGQNLNALPEQSQLTLVFDLETHFSTQPINQFTNLSLYHQSPFD